MRRGSTLHQQGTVLGFFRPSSRRRVRDTAIIETRIFLGPHHFQGSLQTGRFSLEQGNAVHWQHKELLSLNERKGRMHVRVRIPHFNEETSFSIKSSQTRPKSHLQNHPCTYPMRVTILGPSG